MCQCSTFWTTVPVYASSSTSSSSSFGFVAVPILLQCSRMAWWTEFWLQGCVMWSQEDDGAWEENIAVTPKDCYKTWKCLSLSLSLSFLDDCWIPATVETQWISFNHEWSWNLVLLTHSSQPIVLTPNTNSCKQSQQNKVTFKKEKIKNMHHCCSYFFIYFFVQKRPQ